MVKPKEERDLRMKVCGNCGREAQDESMFCKYCGARLDQPVQEEAHQEGARQRKFCPNCGGSLEGAVDFCPNCGERLRGEAGGGAQGRSPQDVRKGVRKPGGKVWKIAGAVAGLCLAAVLVVWLAGTVFASPAKKFATYQEKTLQALFVDGLAEAAEAYNQYMHLSTDMTLTASSSDQELERYLEDSAIELKVEMGEDSALINSALTLLGSQVVTADLTYDKGVAGFYIPELDDTYYTVDLAELDEGFGPELENLKNTEIPVKDLEKLANKYIGLFVDVVNKDNVTVSDEKTFWQEELREEVKGKTYIFEPSAAEIEDFMLVLADTLEEDEELREFIMEVQGDNLALFMDDFEGEMEDVILDLCDELRNNASYFGDSMEGMRWVMGVSGNEVLMQYIESSDGSSRFGYETDGSRTVFYMTNYGETMLIDMEKEGKKGEENGSVAVYTAGTEVMELKFRDMDVEKMSALQFPYGKYEMTMYGYMGYTLEVEEGEDGGTDHTFTLSMDPYYMGGSMGGDLTSVEITLNTSDKDSTASKPKAHEEDITYYSEAELSDLADHFEEMLYNLIYDSGILYELGYLW